jgi:hypothetical protein
MTGAMSLLSAGGIEPNIGELGQFMRVCVLEGASVGYIVPYTEKDGEAFWREKVLEPVRAGGRVLWVARVEGRIAARCASSWCIRTIAAAASPGR